MRVGRVEQFAGLIGVGMAVTHGMDVGEVRRLGGSLQSKAAAIDEMVRLVDRSVSGSSWVGPDASRFRTQWWPEHRVRLMRASEDLYGLGQSALNNADAQERASGPDGEGQVLGLATWQLGTGAWSSAGLLVVMRAFFDRWFATDSPGASSRIPEERSGDGSAAGEAHVGAFASDSTSAVGHSAGAKAAAAWFAAQPSGGDVGDSSGELPGSHREYPQVQKVYEAKSVGMGLGDKSIDGEKKYQCTAWAHFRWRELAEERGIDIGTIQTGNGGELAGNNGGSADAAPTLGAMASYGDHVAIVEEVDTRPDGRMRFRVSEMNASGDGTFPAEADEYRSKQWFAERTDGTWAKEGGGGVGEVVFAEFPGGS